MDNSNSLKMLTHRSKNTLIPLILFVISFVCFSIPVFLNEGRLFSTDQEVFIRAAENLRTRFSVVEPSPLNEKFQTSIIDSRENPYVSKHHGLISQYPPGQSMILALLRTFIPNYNLIECFIGAIGIILFYFLVMRLFGKQTAIFCALSLIFTPIYFFWSLFALVDITAFVVLLLAILTYLQARKTEKTSFYMLCCLCLGITIWLKYVNIILTVPFFIHYLMSRKKGEKLRPILAGILIFCLCIIALLCYHNWAFGGFLTTGYDYNELKSSTEYAKKSVITILRQSLLSLSVIKRIMTKLTNFPIHIAVCSPLTVLGLFGCFSLKRKDWRAFSLLFLISLSLLCFYMTFGGHEVGWRYYHQSTISSYNRYILPAYCLLMIPAVIFFRNLSIKKFYMVLAIITMMNLFSLVFATINLSNLHWLLADQKATYKLQQRHLKLTSDESIIIGQHAVFYMVNTNRHTIGGTKPLGSSIFRKELTRVVHALLKDGYDVYVVQDYEEELDFGNADWELIDEETSLYKLNKKGKPG